MVLSIIKFIIQALKIYEFIVKGQLPNPWKKFIYITGPAKHTEMYNLNRIQ